MKELLQPPTSKNIFTQNLFRIVPTIIELPEKISNRIETFGTSLRERRFTEVDDPTIEKAFIIFDRICEDFAYGALTRDQIPEVLAGLREEDIQLEFLVGLSLERGTWYPLNYPTSLNNGRQEESLSQCYFPVFGQSL